MNRPLFEFSVCILLVLLRSLCVQCEELILVESVSASNDAGGSNNVMTEAENNMYQCDLYLSKSSIPNAGLGIFAGQNYNLGDVVAYAYTIYIPYNYTSGTELENYVFGTEDEEYSMLMLGVGSLFNHAFTEKQQSAQQFWYGAEKYNQEQFATTLSAEPLCYFETLKPLSRFEEIFISYGDNWFDSEHASRGKASKVDTMDSNITSQVPTTEKEENQDRSSRSILKSFQDIGVDSKYIGSNEGQVSICMSDVYVNTSRIAADHNDHSEANFGLFSWRSFKKGELITVSPALKLRMDAVENSKMTSLLINFVYSKANSTIGFLPLAYASLLNHYRSYANILNDNHVSRPNVGIKWFEWIDNYEDELSSDEDDSSRTMLHGQGLYDLLSRPLDDAHSDEFAKFYFGYYALRDIDAEEELTIDYGRQWESAYIQYRQSLLEHQKKGMSKIEEYEEYREYEEDELRVEDVRFRHWSEVPDHFFPSHWMN